jgi:hypothetical protein
VRDPLVWLGEPDPVDSQEKSRADDQDRNDLRELFALWPSYMLIGAPYTTARIIDIAEGVGTSGFATDDLKTLLLRVAEARRKPPRSRMTVWAGGCARSAGAAQANATWSAGATERTLRPSLSGRVRHAGHRMSSEIKFHSYV